MVYSTVVGEVLVGLLREQPKPRARGIAAKGNWRVYKTRLAKGYAGDSTVAL